MSPGSENPSELLNCLSAIHREVDLPPPGGVGWLFLEAEATSDFPFEHPPSPVLSGTRNFLVLPSNRQMLRLPLENPPHSMEIESMTTVASDWQESWSCSDSIVPVHDSPFGNGWLTVTISEFPAGMRSVMT